LVELLPFDLVDLLLPLLPLKVGFRLYGC